MTETVEVSLKTLDAQEVINGDIDVKVADIPLVFDAIDIEDEDTFGLAVDMALDDADITKTMEAAQ